MRHLGRLNDLYTVGERLRGLVTLIVVCAWFVGALAFVIEDSEVYPSQPSVMLDGIKGPASGLGIRVKVSTVLKTPLVQSLCI